MYFYSNMSKMLPFKHIINVKLINDIFYFFVVGAKSLEFSVTYSTSQFGLATF